MKKQKQKSEAKSKKTKIESKRTGLKLKQKPKAKSKFSQQKKPKQIQKSKKAITKSKNKFKFKNTIILSSLIVLVYLALSPTLLFIPTSTLLAFGFNWGNLVGLFTYSFLHISPAHLVGNLILLLSVGFIAESKLSSKEFYGIYLTAGALSAVVYGFLFPQNYLVGASAAISALLAIAFIIDIKKTLVFVLFASLMISIISPELQVLTQTKFAELQEQSYQLQKSLKEVNNKIAIAKSLNKSKEASELIENKSKQIQQFNKTSNNLLVVNQGIEREKHAQTSPLVHLAGAFTGIGYLFLFRRELIWKIPSQIMPRNWLQKSLKKN